MAKIERRQTNEQYFKAAHGDFHLENIFQEKYYNEDLLRFLDNIWQNPAEYKVMMARRMLNLNYALMHEILFLRDRVCK